MLIGRSARKLATPIASSTSRLPMLYRQSGYSRALPQFIHPTAARGYYRCCALCSPRHTQAMQRSVSLQRAVPRPESERLRCRRSIKKINKKNGLNRSPNEPRYYSYLGFRRTYLDVFGGDHCLTTPIIHTWDTGMHAYDTETKKKTHHHHDMIHCTRERKKERKANNHRGMGGTMEFSRAIGLLGENSTAVTAYHLPCGSYGRRRWLC